ncbi:hypothetical protein RFI_08146 [Reticulomyxa filosa]|uniref:Uncharacterized protein n=1 Tax=Reticulomyxa filosa TaxID=46433 RepID=X6NTB0_RETFI|nr:hypothetical protein RFI_08146 [Reticulomyxa filosa]|eukprot:ETO28979.1 hypothetical protein RFI_08146 [Reticulomyxa filosa]
MPEESTSPVKFQSKPVPKSTYSNSLTKIEQLKKHRKEKLKEKSVIEQANSKILKLTTDSRPAHIDRIRQELAEAEQNIQSQQFKAVEVPVAKTECAVRLTTAAILREDALVRRQQQREVELIKEFEKGLYDSKDFDKWKDKQHESERIAKEMQMQQLKLQTQQTLFTAKKAVQHNKQLKFKETSISKEEQKQRQQQKQEEDDSTLEKKKTVVQEVQLNELNAVEAKKQRKEENKSMAIEMNQSAQRLKEEHERQKIEEMRQKKLLIFFFEKIWCSPFFKKTLGERQFDPTSTADHRLLTEMSLIELQTRLAHCKLLHKAEVSHKKKQIQSAKKSKHQILMWKAQNLSKIRNLRKQAVQEQKIKNDAKLEKLKAANQSKQRLFTLHTQQLYKQMEEAKLMEQEDTDIKIQAIKQQQKKLTQIASDNDRRKWQSYMQSVQRVAKEHQTKTENDQNAQLTLRSKEAVQRIKNNTIAKDSKARHLKISDETFGEAKQAALETAQN